MQSRLVITEDTIAREIEVAPGTVNSDERDLTDFLKEVGKRAPLETGILPPGVISIRQAGDHMQLVHQSPPGVNLINWGTYERDANAKTYALAQPYRVVVGDFVNGALLGCRMFYSPEPIASIDQPLYHQNVPNINCKGYNETGVGWVCLYHRESWDGMDIAAKARRMAERCSGVETYNDRNMSGTDGTRFYKAKGKPAYLCSPTAWEKKSDTDGFEWTLDKDLWIPVLVKDQDHQDKHYENGVPLTLRMAMEGDANCYYRDTYWPKPINGLARKSTKVTGKDLYEKVLNGAYVATKPGKTTTKAAAKKVATSPLKKVASSTALTPANQAAYEAIKNTLKAPAVPVVASAPVSPPLPVYNCTGCGIEIFGFNDHQIHVPATGKTEHFCTDHIEMIRICCHCGLIVQVMDTMSTKEGLDICLNCATDCVCTQCGLLFNYNGGNKVCAECDSQVMASNEF